MSTEAPTIVLTVDGTTVRLNILDVTARQGTAFRLATGRSVRSAFAALEDDADLDTLAGLLWLGRMQAGEKVAFVDVADSVTYRSEFEVDVEAPEVDEDGESDPEA